MSSFSRAATSLNSRSMCPGEKTSSIRRGVSDRLHQACGTPFLTVTAVPAGASNVLVPIGDVESALQNDEMLILILVDMHGAPFCGSATNSSIANAPSVSSTEVRILKRSPGVICNHSPLPWCPFG